MILLECLKLSHGKMSERLKERASKACVRLGVPWVRIPLFPMNIHPAWIEVDTAQFRRNLSAIRRKIGNRLFCLPVKANAYGHGLCPVAKIAQEAGVDSLGVSCLQEAAALRRSGISIPILVFGAIHEDQISSLIELDLECSISSKYKAQLVADQCKRLGRTCKVHLEIDTGMRRTGVRPSSALDLLHFVDHLGCFEVAGMYSHLATADLPFDLNAENQIAVFRDLANQVKDRGILCHLANSGGVAYYPDSYFDMVRPGLLSYGYFPGGEADPQGEISPCFSLRAKISYFKVVGGGSGISYGHTYRTASQTRVVTVPIGHGDGYRRLLSQSGSVLIRGERFRIAGTICMDQFMVDIGNRDAYVGDEVVLIGKQGTEEISMWEFARFAQSIPHEMLCAFNERIPRIFV